MDQWEQTIWKKEAIFQATEFIVEGSDSEQWQTKPKGPSKGNVLLEGNNLHLHEKERKAYMFCSFS